jgi:deazaflavin-dependent oxidoreductase (nitroreductase family)
VAAGRRLRDRLYRLPIGLRALGVRGYERLLGVEWVVVTTRGRRSARPHTVILDVVGRAAGEDTVYVSPANGRRSDWVRNALVHPEVGLEVGGRRLRALARDATGAEGAEVMLRFVREHPRYARLVAALGAFEDVSRRPDDEVRDYLRTVVVIALAIDPPSSERDGIA